MDGGNGAKNDWLAGLSYALSLLANAAGVGTLGWLVFGGSHIMPTRIKTYVGEAHLVGAAFYVASFCICKAFVWQIGGYGLDMEKLNPFRRRC
jgi:hypothetical protein